jgi:hypothetical protein
MKKRVSLYTLPFAALFALPEFLSGAAFVLAKRGLTEAKVFGIRSFSCLIAGLLLAGAISLFEQKFDVKRIKALSLSALNLLPFGLCYGCAFVVSLLFFRRLSLNTAFALCLDSGRYLVLLILIYFFLIIFESLMTFLAFRTAGILTGFPVVKILAVVGANAFIVLFNGFRTGIFSIIPILTGTFMGRLVAYLAEAALCAFIFAILERFVAGMPLFKASVEKDGNAEASGSSGAEENTPEPGSGNNDAPASDIPDTKPLLSALTKDKLSNFASRLIYAGAAALAFLLVFIIGSVSIKRLNPMHELSEEVLNYTNAALITMANGNVEQGFKLAGAARGDVLMWEALGLGKNNEKRKEKIAEALKLGENNVYIRLLEAADLEKVDTVERMIMQEGVTNTAVDFMLLRMYAEFGSEPDSQKQAVRKEILYRQLNAGNYIDGFVTVSDANDRLGEDKVDENLEKLHEIIPYSKVIEIYYDALANNGGTKEQWLESIKAVSETDEVYKPYFQTYFLSKIKLYLDGDANDGEKTDYLISLAEAVPNDLVVNFSVAGWLAERNLRRYQYDSREEEPRFVKARAAIRSAYELYEKKYKAYQEAPENEKKYVDNLANAYFYDMGYDLDPGSTFDTKTRESVRRMFADIFLAINSEEDALALLEGTAASVTIRAMDAIYAKNYDEALSVASETLKTPATDLENAQIEYIRAVAYLNKSDRTNSFEHAAKLASYLGTLKDSDKAAADSMLLAFTSMFSYDNGYYYLTMDYLDNATDSEKAILKSNEYLYAYVCAHEARVKRTRYGYAWFQDRPYPDDFYEYYDPRMKVVDDMLAKDPALSGLWYIKACMAQETTTGGSIGFGHLMYEWEEPLLLESEEYLKKAIEYDFTNPAYHFMLGCVYDELARYIDAYREACYADQYYEAVVEEGGINGPFLNQADIDHLKIGLENFFKSDGHYHDMRTEQEGK